MNKTGDNLMEEDLRALKAAFVPAPNLLERCLVTSGNAERYTTTDARSTWSWQVLAGRLSMPMAIALFLIAFMGAGPSRDMGEEVLAMEIESAQVEDSLALLDVGSASVDNSLISNQSNSNNYEI